ncbi:MAG TPA: hypothetical protein VNM92_10225 [Thermoanaerobaculia bacterium]|nr:hypothetical protein [Thermoanaerobaculia bacterium]
MILDRRGDEAIAAAMDGFDRLLTSFFGRNRLSRLHDGAAQRGFADECRLPDLLEKLVFRDDPVAVSHEVKQNVQYARLHADNPGAFSELI